MRHFLGGYTFGVGAVLTFALAVVLKLWVAWHACATLAEARRTGAVELLLATPLTIEDIMHGHWQALQRSLLWPVIALLGLQLVSSLDAFTHQEASMRGWLFFLPIPAVTVFAMITLVLDLVALAWVGMWMGLSQPKFIQAFAKTLLFVSLVPMVVFCFPNILFDLFWISWGRRKLEREFRRTATERYAPAAQEAWLSSPRRPLETPPVIRA